MEFVKSIDLEISPYTMPNFNPGSFLDLEEFSVLILDLVKDPGIMSLILL